MAERHFVTKREVAAIEGVIHRMGQRLEDATMTNPSPGPIEQAVVELEGVRYLGWLEMLVYLGGQIGDEELLRGASRPEVGLNLLNRQFELANKLGEILRG